MTMRGAKLPAANFIAALILLPLSIGLLSGNLLPHTGWNLPAFTALAQSLPPSDRPHIASHVIVLIADKLTAEDFIEFPQATASLHELTQRGAVGLMNVRTAGAANSGNGYLSLGTGRRALAGTKSGETYSLTEPVQGRAAQDVYTAITGNTPSGQALHIGIGQLRSLTKSTDLPAGSLGDILNKAGYSTALLGNGDVPGQRLRYGALLTMNTRGTVDHASIGDDNTIHDPTWPTGFRTNYSTLLSNLQDTLSVAQFIVVDMTDLSRLEDVASYLEPAHAVAVRERALEDISQFVRRVIELTDESGIAATIYLVSPSPSQHFGRQGILMTPTIRWGHDRKEGLLTSPTTRRPGIVTNFDFLPSILAEFALDRPDQLVGRPWTVRQSPSAFPRLLDQYVAIREVHLQRLPIIQPYFFVVLGIFAAGLFLTIAVGRNVIAWNRTRDVVWRSALCAIAAYPLVLLLIAALPTSSLLVTSARVIAFVGAIALVTSLVLHRFPQAGADLIGAVGLVTTVVILWDTLTGATLMQGSLLGYDPVAGSRFYGIGNEYMGVLMGASLMATAFILNLQAPSKSKVLWPALIFIIIGGIMAHPRLGINVGGAITAAGASVAAIIFSQDKKITIRQGAKWGLTLTSLLIAVAIADMKLLRDNASHLGRAAAMVSTAGADPLWDIFSRKIAINIRLMRLTIWSRVALGSLGLLSILFLWPNWLGKRLQTHYPWLVRMSRACLVSALVTLVVNDSGVVAAATLLLWPALAILSVAIHLAWQPTNTVASP